ncbi:uncharacterized protein N7459_006265 [Penicillium hispanicum]|uniref:uncharacterized protein n=1 Tax=Penicillium hispanicum TaxID=1080232 RepID=UPI00253FA4F1|nr:uncharacterized protein N7459_006265 [Penicillium hispanicum]KAJ5580280.1 hypothetical protein N7459_006265 [Penicillium hispanicum]
MAASGRDDGGRPGEQTPLLKGFEDRQSHVLPHRRLMVVFPALALVQFTSFLDQTAISTTLPAIAADLKTGSSISWISASFLTTSTSIQLINGRLSDIFGRRTCLMTALAIMGFGNFLSGLSRTPAQLYATRAVSGFGAGALNALVQIAISDITTLEQRGYYFGIMGIAVALGNGLGPLIGGLLTEYTSWRWAFFFISPLTAAAIVYLLVLPQHSMADNVWQKLCMVDWLGVVMSMAAIFMILLPISRGGSAVAWDSPFVIASLTIGAVLLVSFVFVEWRFAKFPILPMRLFQYSRSTNTLLGMNILIGWVFWGNLLYIPLYFQNVRGYSPSVAASFILPMVIAHGMTSGLSGILVSRSGHYMPVIRGGAMLWVIGTAAKCWYHHETPTLMFYIVGILEGIGVGCSLQPMMVGLLAGSDKADRGVITGLRNFIRDTGGAMGTIVSGAILNGILKNQLQGHWHFSPHIISQLTSSALSLSKMKFSDAEIVLIKDAYMKGLHGVFLSYVVLAVLLLTASLFVEDYGLAGKTFQQPSPEGEQAE